jgi:hypothetical protein
MFARYTLVFFALFGLALATPCPTENHTWGSQSTHTHAPAPSPTSNKPASNCQKGNLQCCDSMKSVSTAIPLLSSLGHPNYISLQAGDIDKSKLSLAELLALLADPGSLVGLTCTPINILGIGGNSCSEQAVCCNNNSFVRLRYYLYCWHSLTTPSFINRMVSLRSAMSLPPVFKLLTLVSPQFGCEPVDLSL